jgi:polyhydroxyalkanoate synthesis regulator phasin
MKKMQTIIAACVLFLGTALSGIAAAAGPPDHPHPMGGHWGHHEGWHHHKGGGDMFVTWAVKKNMMVQVLSQLSGKPADTIENQLKEKRLPAVLAEYKIDRKAFHDAIRTKADALIKLLADNGYLTQEQSTKIIKEMAERDQRRQERHEVMTRLIDKGLKEGTITKEQAEMLMPHHH